MQRKVLSWLMLSLLFSSNLSAANHLRSNQVLNSVEKENQSIKQEKIDESSKMKNVLNSSGVKNPNVVMFGSLATVFTIVAVASWYKYFSNNNNQNPAGIGDPGSPVPGPPYNPIVPNTDPLGGDKNPNSIKPEPTGDPNKPLVPKPDVNPGTPEDAGNGLASLIPGETDFLKDEKTIKDYIDKTIPKVTKILEKQKAVADLKSAEGKDVMIIGDIHGDEKTLKWVIKNSYEHLKNGGSVVFLGDLVDQRFREPDKSIETILWALHLVKLFPNQVVVIRGNHDSVTGGWLGSIKPYKCDKLNSCMAALPIACEIQSNGRKFFCVHGYIPLLNDYSNFKNKVKKINLFNDTTDKSGEFLEYGMMWNDPIGPTSEKNGKKNGKTDTEQGCGSIWVGKEATKNFFASTGYKAIFRGHDPKEHDIDIKIDQNHVFTIHSLSWFTDTYKCTVEQGSPRNARIALVSENDVKIKYFQDDEKGPDLTINI